MGIKNNLYKITLDNNESIVCTDNHKFMCRNHSFVEAKNLKVGQSMMPIYIRNDSICNASNRRKRDVLQTDRDEIYKYCKTENTYIHHLVFLYFHPEFSINDISGKNSKYVIHHKNGNHLDNSPSNLELLSRASHSHYHQKIDPSFKKLTAEQIEKAHITFRKKLQEDKQFKEEVSNRGRNNFLKLWSNEEFREIQLPRCRENFERGREKSNKDPKAISNRQKSRIIRGLSLLYYRAETKNISEDEYELYREKYSSKGRGRLSPPKLSYILKYFNSYKEASNEAKIYNHKIIKIEKLNNSAHVYDLTTKNNHNFALACGIFAHNCSSVHAEQNAIISASRQEMIDSTLYLVGMQIPPDIDLPEEYVPNPSPCCLCRRMIINAGIQKVIVRTSLTEYVIFEVKDWKGSDLVGGY